MQLDAASRWNRQGVRSAQPMALPTFEADAITLHRRLTLVADVSGITKVFYPVFPPDRNAADVIGYLQVAG